MPTLSDIFTNDLGITLRIRHRTSKQGNFWYGVCSPVTGMLHHVGGGAYSSMSGFASAHHRFKGERVHFTANGWKECEYEPLYGSRVFITTNNCRADFNRRTNN